jgi:hypothetical protein
MLPKSQFSTFAKVAKSSHVNHTSNPVSPQEKGNNNERSQN